MQAIIILALYFVVIFLIGVLTHRYSKTKSDFFLANHRLGLLTTTASLTATGIGGSATVVSLIYVYRYGLSGIWMNLAAGLGLLLLGFFYARRIRALGVYSLPDVAGKLYDPKTRLAASIISLVVQIAWLALLIQATALVLSAVIEIDPLILIVVSTGLFVLYTLLGGQFAVSYSDVFQFFLMFAGVGIVAVLVLLDQAGGVSFWKSLSPDLLKFPFSEKVDLWHVLSLFLLMGLSHMVGPDIYAKILSARNSRVARNAALFSGVLRMVWALIIGLLGLLALKLLPDLENPVKIIPGLLVFFENPLLHGFVVTAFLATMMSSADTVLLTGATIFTHDLLPRLQKKEPALWQGKVFMVFKGSLALLLALYYQDVIKTLELAYTVFASGLIIPLMLGFWASSLKINSRGALVAMLGGGSLALLLKLKVLSIFSGVNEIIPGTALSFILLFLVSWVTGSKK